jgi:CarD family transcriptional regulator
MTNVPNNKHKQINFKIGDSVVYPSHGVGTVVAEESQIILGTEQRFYVVTFEKDKMTLKVPKSRAEKAGLRNLSSSDDLEKALITLKSKAKSAKGMWSKRAQEYEGKINSGNVLAIAEVLRDLHKNVDDPNRSYSERMIYEAAFERFAGEYAVTANLVFEEANKIIKEILEEAKLLYQEAA